jgi:hypothetical protein
MRVKGLSSVNAFMIFSQDLRPALIFFKISDLDGGSSTSTVGYAMGAV